MNRTILTCLLALVVTVPAALGVFPGTTDAAGRNVTVHLPSFLVSVDGRNIDSTTLKYPLLEYKEITYFPMTWNVGQGMGLKTNWTAETGLHIDAIPDQKTELVMEQGGSFRQGRSYQAQIANFPVTVNAQGINNSAEPYPLLEFQGITYFPMTWRFAHDSFRWETGWSVKNGFSIKTAQRPYIGSIVHDDEYFLYAAEVNGGGMFRIDKRLKETPYYLDKEAASQIREASELRSKPTMPDRGLELERKEDKLYFQGIELLSLAPYFQKNKDYAKQQPQYPVDPIGVDYRASYVKLDDQTSLISVQVYYLTFIPAPYTPHEQMTFLLKDGKAAKLDGFTQSIDGFSKAEGGAWVWSSYPAEIRARNGDQRGQVMWVGTDGKVSMFNDLLKAQNIAMLQPRGHEAIVCAYTLAGTDPMTEGYFRLKDDGSFEKSADVYRPVDENGYRSLFFQPAYADANGDLYSAGLNSVTNLTSGQTASWWDYELNRLVKP